MKPSSSVILIILIIAILGNFSTTEGFTSGKTGKTCNSCSVGNGHRNSLLPILNPKFNLREIAKNMLLLEDHLFQKRKRCNDCIKKHFLIIEGLAEEMVTLDTMHKCAQHYNLADQIRSIEKKYINGMKHDDIAQNIRLLRKTLMNSCFSEF